MNHPTYENAGLPWQVCEHCGNWLRVHWRGRACWVPPAEAKR